MFILAIVLGLAIVAGVVKSAGGITGVLALIGLFFLFNEFAKWYEKYKKESKEREYQLKLDSLRRAAEKNRAEAEKENGSSTS